MNFQFMWDGKPLRPQGWSASYNKSVDTMYAPIHINGEVVALVVAHGDVCMGRVMTVGNMIVQRCNAANDLIDGTKLGLKYVESELDPLLAKMKTLPPNEVKEYEVSFTYRTLTKHRDKLTKILKDLGIEP